MTDNKKGNNLSEENLNNVNGGIFPTRGEIEKKRENLLEFDEKEKEKQK